MTHDEIRAFIERYVESWKREDVRGLAALYAENARIESPLFHTVIGQPGIEKSFRDLFGAFSDWDFRIDDLIIDSGDEAKAVLACTTRITHRGDLLGMPGTGRRLENKVVHILRFENGRIVSDRRLYDFTGVLVQLGVLKAKAV
jgi:steroid delta-isomerase-like uncharacterized protein